jgi:acyl-CoA synthetase (AMP-forming)/AMP-acid ligase II
MREDMIAYWARQTPDAPAIIAERAVGYRTFDAAINQVAARLLTLSPPETGRVVVQMNQLHLLFLVEQALDRLGLTSAILPPTAPPDELLDLLRPDLFLTQDPAHAARSAKAVLIDGKWISEALKGPPAPPPGRPRREDDLVRIVVSSGTTGVPKKVPVTRSSLALRLRMRTVLFAIGQGSRSICVMGPQTISGFTDPRTLWSVGGAVCIPDGSRLYAEMIRLNPTHVQIATGQLEQLLRQLPDDPVKFPATKIRVNGSRVSRALATRAVESLGAQIWIGYGSTEVTATASGHVSVLDRHEGAVGYPSPFVEVEVVDARDRPLPAGEAGILRIKAEGQFSGYLDDAATTAATLKDGWFYPGDYASLTQDGMLVIEGRIAETINLGGVKIDPAAIDETARTSVGVLDAAAFAVPDANGIDRPWIAVVRGEDFSAARLLALLQSRWPALRDLKIASIDVIPRNEMVKVERRKLKQMVIDARGRAGAGAG